MKKVINIKGLIDKGKREIAQCEINSMESLCETLDWLKEGVIKDTTRVPIYAILHISFANVENGKRSSLEASRLGLSKVQPTTYEEILGTLSVLQHKLHIENTSDSE